MKSTIRQVMASMYHATNHFMTRLKGKVLILMYHRVLTEKYLKQHYIQPGMFVLDDVFEKQMQFLKEYFQILSFDEALNIWSKKGVEDSQRYCIITFDDGWLDNYIHAYPVLRKYDIPATIFLPTEFIGANQWFWTDQIGFLLRYYCIESLHTEKKESMTELRDRYPWMKNLNGKPCSEKIDSIIEICKDLPEDEIHSFIDYMSKLLAQEIPDDRLFLDWDEIKEMSQHRISFGSHSSTHRILTKPFIKEMQKEIEDSLHILREKQINYIPVFCYPNGDYTHEIMNLVKDAGYQAAVSAHFGFESRSPKNLFALKRIGIHNDISSTIPLFSWHISGLEQSAKKAKVKA